MQTVLIALDVVKRIAAIALMILAGLAGWHVYRTVPLAAIAGNVRATTGNLATTSANLQDASEALKGKHGLKQLLYNADTVTAQIGRTSNTVRLAAVEQRKQAKDSAEKLGKAIGDLADLVGNTDKSLNGEKGLLPTLTTDVQKTGGLLDELQGEDGLLAAGTETLHSANAAIGELRPGLKEASEQLGEAAEHGNSAAGHVDRTLGYIEKSFQPKKVSFWGRVVNAVLPEVLRGIVSALFPERVKVVNEVQIKSGGDKQ